jgi:hypothetical protein
VTYCNLLRESPPIPPILSPTLPILPPSGGAPDDKRIPINITSFVQAVDTLAAEALALTGRPVLAVYFCSDTPETNYQSAAYLAAEFPRPWR